MLWVLKRKMPCKNICKLVKVRTGGTCIYKRSSGHWQHHLQAVEPVQETSVDLNVIITEQLRKNAEKFDRIREAYRNGVDTLDEYKENKRMVRKKKRCWKSSLQT